MKRKKLILSFLFLFFMCLSFQACKTNQDFSFTVSDITLSINETIDLKDYVKLTDCKLEDITFRSSDINALSISEDNILIPNENAVGKVVIVTANLHNKYAFIEIEIIGERGQFSVPESLKYDEETNTISWDKSKIITSDSSVIFATDYTLYVKNTNSSTVTEKEIVVANNSFVVDGFGDYTFKVKANQNGYNGESAYSNEFTFKKLKQVENLKYDDISKMFVWDSVDEAVGYEIYVNGMGVYIEGASQYPYIIESNKKYDIYVVAKSDDDNIKSSKSNIINIERLNAPTLSISGGLLTWVDAGAYVDHYVLTITSDATGEIVKKINLNNTFYDFANIDAGKYSAKIEVVAQAGYGKLDSKNLSEISDITKLKAPIISFDNGEYEFIIDNAFDGKTNLSYTINSLSEIKELNKDDDGKYRFDYNSEVGRYTFSARNLATTNTEINSEYSNIVVVEKLAKVSMLTHRVDESGTYIIDFANKENYGEGKSLSVEYLKGQDAIKQTDSWNCDSLFATAGEYFITVKVNGTSNGVDYFTVSNQSVLKVVRIANTQVNKNNDSVAWVRVDNAKEYKYIISKINDITKEVEEIIESKTSEAIAYDLSSLNLAHGTYLFEVKPLAIQGNIDLYLNAKDYASVEFTKEEKITSPILTFDRLNNDIVLTNRDINATAYTIEAYNAEGGKIEHTFAFDANDRCNIADFITEKGAGRYTFKAFGTNDETSLINSSEIGEIVIEKLPVPTKLKIVQGEKIEIASLYSDVDVNSLSSTIPYTIQINDENTDLLNSSRSDFVVKASYNAKDIIFENVNYLSSDIAIFNLKRLSTPENITLQADANGKYLSLPLSLNTTIYTKLKFSQDGKTFDYIATSTNLYINDISIDGFDANQQFSVCAYYEPKILDNIVSSELNSIKSFNTNNLLVEKQSTINNLCAQELDDGRTVISWDSVEGAGYELLVNGTIVNNNIENNSYTFDASNFADTSSNYVIKVRAVSEDKIDGEYSEIKLQRLKAPNKTLINKDEILSIIHDNNQSYISAIEYYVNDSIATTDISEIDGAFNVKVRIKAITTVSNNTYFLSSAYVSYNLTRLSTPDTLISFVGEDYDTKYLSVKLNSDSNVKTMLVLAQESRTFIYEATSEKISISSINVSGFDNKKAFEVSYYYCSKNEVTELSKSNVTYLKSYLSSKTVVEKQQVVTNITVAENEDIVEISWNKIDGTNIAYRILIDDVDKYVVYNSDFTTESIIKFRDISGIFDDAKTYNVKIATIDMQSLNSDNCLFTIERLACPSITVSNTEDVRFNYTIAEGKLQTIEIKINGHEVPTPLNLSSYNGTFDMTIKMIATDNSSQNAFVISSKVATFSFDRISAISLKPIIKDGEISWAEFDDVTYKLMFNDGDTELFIDNLTESSISVATQSVVNIVKQLSSEFNIYVKASVGSFTISDGESHKLSSVNSESQTVTKLQINTNVNIVAIEDKEQRQVKISWDKPSNLTEGKFCKYIVSAYKQNKSTLVDGFPIEVSDYNTTEIISDKFAEVGIYYVSVQTVGQDNVIYSDVSEFAQVVRLASPTDVSITPTGYITFKGTEKANSYLIKLTSDNAELNKEIAISETYYQLTGEELAEAFNQLGIEIIAIGDKQNTLSSSYSKIYNATRLTAPDFSLTANSITYSNTYATSNFTYDCKILFDGEQLLNYQNITNDTTYDIQRDIYKDLPTEKLSARSQLTIIVTAISSQSGYLSSLSTTKTAIKLATPSNLSFKKTNIQTDAKSAEYSKIHFGADYVINAFKYVLSIGEYSKVFELGEVISNRIDLEITDEILSKIDNAWTLAIYAQGGNEAGVVYFNSPISTISGTKLESVSSARTNNGKLVWGSVANSTDYLIKLNGTTYYTQYSKCEEIFEGESGQLTLNIKAIGNLGENEQTLNIVLDSDYMIQDYVCTKLAKPSNVKLNLGYIAFDSINNATSYKAWIDGNEYLLTATQLGGLIGTNDTSIVYICDDIYNDLLENKDYSAKFFAESDEDDVIYSDMSDIITINILQNVNVGKLTVDFAEASTSGKKDYTKSILHWDLDTTIGAGHLLKIQQVAIGVPQISVQLGDDYTLDIDKSWAVGDTYLSLATLGGYVDGVYYMTSKYTENYIVTKLQSPVPDLSIENQDVKYSWTQIKNADAYYALLDGQSVNYDGFTGTYAYNITDNFGTGTKIFEKFEVVAISKNPKYLASSYAEYTNENHETIKILRPGAPDAFTIENGTMRWNLNINLSDALKIKNGELVCLDKPFATSTSEIFREKVYIKFFNEASQTAYGPYIINPVLLIKLSGILADYASNIFGENNIKEGFPSLKLNFADFAIDLPAGEYKVSVKLLPYGETNRGTEDAPDNYFKLGSAYNTPISVYVANAPTANIEYNADDDSYYYIFNEIQKGIYTKYFDSDVNYSIVLENEDGKRELLETTGFGKNIANSYVQFKDGKCYVNLTAYIEDGKINQNHKKIFVYVAGRSDKNNVLLNGKVSNIIGITILDEVNAYVTDGVISWTSDISGQEYKIDYSYGTNHNSTILESNTWYGEELTVGTEYSVKIKALGQKGKTSQSITLSSKSTNIGKVSKLYAPTICVKDGELAWDNIANASRYFVEYKSGESDFNALQDVSVKQGEATYYQSTLTNEDGECRYFVTSIGNTLSQKLTSESTSYLTSIRSDYLTAVVLKPVTRFTSQDGILIWDSVYRDESTYYRVGNYKLTFIKLKEDDTTEQSEKIVTRTDNSYDCASSDGDEFASGKYSSFIQAYYKTEDEGAKINGVYYLIGTKSTFAFEKLAQVKDINIMDGEISWNYADESLSENYNYKLFFTYSGGNTEKMTDINSFKDCVEDMRENTNIYNLKIRTMPKENNIGYVYSDYTNYQSIVGEGPQNINIQQLKGINAEDGGEVLIKNAAVDVDGEYILETPNNTGPVIAWDDYSHGVANLYVSYQIMYKKGADGSWNVKGGISKPHVSLEKLLGSSELSSDEIFTYMIRVVPNGDVDYLPSNWSIPRELTLPKPIECISFDDNEQYFYWEMQKDSGGNYSTDIKYIVNDYILADDDSILCSYRYEIQSTSENIFDKDVDGTTKSYIKFIPSRQGRHKVSVAVMIANAGDSSLISQPVFYGDEEGAIIVEINLFGNLPDLEDGTKVYADGTEMYPYIISSAEQFNNIKYRLQKPVYLNNYIKYEGDSQNSITEDSFYYFKQSTDIELSATDILMQSGDDIEFNAVYDGANMSITWDYDLSNDQNIFNKGYVSLFGVIQESGVVKNLQIYARFVTNDKGEIILNKAMGISLIAYKNFGKIQNCVLGNNATNDYKSTFNISSPYNTTTIGLGAFYNYGEINRVINEYSVTIKSEQNTCSVGLISHNNYGQIYQSSNSGEVLINAPIATFGGMCVTVESGASIKECSNVGKITLILEEKGDSSTMNIGGLVGSQQEGGIIEDCYATCEFNIYSYLTSTNYSTINIGGLIGYSANLYLKRSYVNISYKNTANDISVYQILGSDNVKQLDNGDNIEKVYYNKNSELLYAKGVGENTASKMSQYEKIDTTLANNLGDKFTLDGSVIKLKWEIEA